jgi:hypothetical protein
MWLEGRPPKKMRGWLRALSFNDGWLSGVDNLHTWVSFHCLRLVRLLGYS